MSQKVADRSRRTDSAVPGALVILLVTTALMLMGSGLFSTLVGIRGHDEGFSSTVIGIIAAGYFMGYIAGAFLCVRAIANVGHIRTFSALSAMVCAAAVAHLLWVDAVAWFVFRVLAGMCIVGMFLVIESWLVAVSSPGTRGRIFALYMGVNLLAMAAGQVLLVMPIIEGFKLFGLAAILLALAVVPTALTRVEAPLPEPAGGLRMGELFRTSSLGFASCLVIGVVGGSFWGLAPVYAAQTGGGDAAVGIFMMAAILGGMVSQWPAGRFSDRHDRVAVMSAVALVLSLSTLFGGLFNAQWNIPPALIGFVFGVCYFPLYPLAVAHTHDHAGPANVVSATRGLMLVYGIGAIIGPVMAGWLMAQRGPHALFLFQGVMGALLACGAVAWRRRHTAAPSAVKSTFVPMMRTSQEALVLSEELASGAPDRPQGSDTG